MNLLSTSGLSFWVPEAVELQIVHPLFIIIFKLAGCPCPNFDCDLLNELADSCLDLSTNENYQFCYHDQKQSLVECLDKCEVFGCLTECWEKFDSDVKRCPCAPGCPSKYFDYDQGAVKFSFLADCPCENYDCDAIQGANTSILILYSYNNYAFDQHVLSPDGSKLLTLLSSNINTSYRFKIALAAFLQWLIIACWINIIDFSGSRVLDGFNYERETQIYYSCSVVLANKMWIFGGHTGGFKKQLSSVAQCHLKTEGTLSFELYAGAANTIEGFHRDVSALICFHSYNKECYS